MTQSHKPRVLLFSQRNIFKKALFRCALYEFENVISQIDSVELLAPEVDLLNRRHAFAKKVAFHAPIAINPGISTTVPKDRYDLFVAICGAPADLLMVNAVSKWKDACQTSLCLVDELWVTQMHNDRHFLRILATFDHVMLYYSGSVKPLSERIGRQCVYLPPGVDTIRFSPYPDPPERVVDVYSIGRRSETTHQRLLQMAEEGHTFYVHDTIAGDQAINSSEHRNLFSKVIKRSRYFIVNPGLIDRPEIRGSQIEIGNRYFEGAAAGAIMVGERPDNGEFDGLFDWPDAMIHLPYGSEQIDTVIANLDKEPEKQATIRRNNVVNALLRHDWAYRWESALKAVNLDPMPQLIERKKRLQDIAADVNRHDAVAYATPSIA